MSRREELAERLATVEGRIAAACEAAGRSRDEVHLVVVTKFFPRSDVDLLAELGMRDLGENREQEAAAKLADGGRRRVCAPTSSVSCSPTRPAP